MITATWTLKDIRDFEEDPSRYRRSQMAWTLVLGRADSGDRSVWLAPEARAARAKDVMKLALSPNDSRDLQAFMPGDTVRRHDVDDDDCVIVWVWRDWLWLDPIEYRGAAPFTGRADDYQLVRRGSL